MKFKFSVSLTIMALGASLMSCRHDDPAPPSDYPSDRTLLIYAVASNNLYYNFQLDSVEILKGVSAIDMSRLDLVLYWVTPKGDAVLKKIEKNEKGEAQFTEVKRYDRNTFSTDPRRITEVISDLKRYCPAESYDMVMCSHGTGWTPSFKDHTRSEISPARVAMHSFGSDRYDGVSDEIDIHELAQAIPDKTFGYIWFDACYMSGIEVIYQFRNKSDYFVGYPTEVWGDGMPYDRTLPYMLRKQPDLKGAADEFFGYYASSNSAATIVVTDNSKIEPLADVCRSIYTATLDYEVDGARLQKYSRKPHGPFYELKDYTLAKAYPLNFDFREFEKALDEFIVTKSCSDYDFNGRVKFNKEIFTGLSCHLYDPESTDENEEYYRTLDWFGRVYR